MGTLTLHAGAVQQAAEILKRGGLVAFPTETVYGLGALGLDPEAVERIFAAKGRPHSDPLILHVADPGWVVELARELPPDASRLMEAFWPGPLTLVLPKSDRVPLVVTAGLDSVAVRMPAHPVALELIRQVGEPLAAPSANLFGRTSPTTARHVLEDLDGRIDAVLDGGSTTVGVESTVLDLRGDSPVILRPGGVTREAVEGVLGRSVLLRGESTTSTRTSTTTRDAPAASPGMMATHYSPRARLRLYDGEGQAVIGAIRREAEAEGDGVGILAFSEDAPGFRDLRAVVVDLGSRERLEEAARGLYAGLRGLDERGVRVIFARTAPPGGLGDAINDRLVRAASGHVERISG